MSQILCLLFLLLALQPKTKPLTPLEKRDTFLFCKQVTIVHQLHRLVLGVKSNEIMCVLSENLPFHFCTVVQFTKWSLCVHCLICT